MKIIRIALAEPPIAALTTSQHCSISLDHKRAVLTTYNLQQHTAWLYLTSPHIGHGGNSAVSIVDDNVGYLCYLMHTVVSSSINKPES